MLGVLCAVSVTGSDSLWAGCKIVVVVKLKFPVRIVDTKSHPWVHMGLPIDLGSAESRSYSKALTMTQVILLSHGRSMEAVL